MLPRYGQAIQKAFITPGHHGHVNIVNPFVFSFDLVNDENVENLMLFRIHLKFDEVKIDVNGPQ